MVHLITDVVSNRLKNLSTEKVVSDQWKNTVETGDGVYVTEHS